MSQTTVPNPTRVDEIADGIYRLATAIDLPDGPGAFSFNQYLIDDDEPLLFHTGPRKLFPLVRQGVEAIMPLSRLRYIGFSHFEADECGALNDFLAAAPRAEPVCGQIAAMVSVNDPLRVRVHDGNDDLDAALR
jgi:flavorubredoxin